MPLVPEPTPTFAPDSLVAAHPMIALTPVTNSLGLVDESEDLAKRSLAIRERLAPGSLAVADSLIALGGVGWERGDLVAAGEYWRRAFKIQEQLAPYGRGASSSLNNLAIVATSRGDLLQADAYFRHALDIEERLNPHSEDALIVLSNLGAVADNRGDLETAEMFLRRSLDVGERLGARSLSLAKVLEGLATVVRRQGDRARADELLGRALAICEREAPGSVDVARKLTTSDDWARERGDWTEAEPLARRALAIQERVVPESLPTAEVLQLLGAVVHGRGDLGQAEQLYAQALSIRSRVAPGSTHEAETLHSLGLVFRDRGQIDEAAEFLARAVDAIESQEKMLGRPGETGAGFAARQALYYKDHAAVLLDLARPREAFHVIERSRARQLLALLAEREISFEGEIPPDLEHERRLLDRQYDKVQAELADLGGAASSEEAEAALARMKALRDKRGALAARIRSASPRLGALRYPTPLDLEGVRRSLNPGTAFLVYSVGRSDAPGRPAPGSPGRRPLPSPGGGSGATGVSFPGRHLVERRAEGGAPMAGGSRAGLWVVVIQLGAGVAPGLGQVRETKRLDSCERVLREVMGMPEAIPRDLLDKAECVVVIPGVKKAALGVGGRFGKGAVVCRTAGGRGPWGPPVMVGIGGASIGFQIGGQSSDFVFLIMNPKGVDHLLKNQFTLGADVSVAAGPKGRTAEVGTDVLLNAEILTYSRSKGLFAGVSLEGAVVKQDKGANQALYGEKISPRDLLVKSRQPVPAAAKGLVKALQELSPRNAEGS